MATKEKQQGLSKVKRGDTVMYRSDRPDVESIEVKVEYANKQIITARVNGRSEQFSRHTGLRYGMVLMYDSWIEPISVEDCCAEIQGNPA